MDAWWQDFQVKTNQLKKNKTLRRRQLKLLRKPNGIQTQTKQERITRQLLTTSLFQEMRCHTMTNISPEPVFQKKTQKHTWVQATSNQLTCTLRLTKILVHYLRRRNIKIQLAGENSVPTNSFPIVRIRRQWRGHAPREEIGITEKRAK